MVKIPNALVELINNFHQDNYRRERDAAKADPKANRDSTLFEKPMDYTYWRSPEKVRGWELKFCYAKHRNVAGYFLSWTEARKGKLVKRVGIIGHQTKREAIERSRWKLAQMKKPPSERTFRPSL